MAGVKTFVFVAWRVFRDARGGLRKPDQPDRAGQKRRDRSPTVDVSTTLYVWPR